ncbi:MAG TPA: SCO family protein [Opitutaceae bacterium]
MNPHVLRLRFLVAASLLATLLPACKRAETAAPVETNAPGEKRFAITGQIVKVDLERKVLLVDHDEIKGYMPPMVMEFAVSAGDLANAREGQRIRAEMVAPEDGDFRLEKIWPVDETADSTVAAAAGALRQDTTIRGRKAYREVGENLPDFALYDQNGAVVSGARFRGKKIMLNFIYTRCPIATMCPAATERMTAVQKAARAAGVENLELVSVTLDPEYDTPGILKDYAQVRGIDTSNFSFLTGPEGAIKDLLTQFGVIAQFDGSILQHTLATLLINEQGRIIHRADGTAWDVQDFVEKMKR